MILRLLGSRTFSHGLGEIGRLPVPGFGQPRSPIRTHDGSNSDLGAEK